MEEAQQQRRVIFGHRSSSDVSAASSSLSPPLPIPSPTTTTTTSVSMTPSPPTEYDIPLSDTSLSHHRHHRPRAKEADAAAAAVAAVPSTPTPGPTTALSSSSSTSTSLPASSTARTLAENVKKDDSVAVSPLATSTAAATTTTTTSLSSSSNNNISSLKHPTADAVLASLKKTVAAATLPGKKEWNMYQSFVLAIHPDHGLMLLDNNNNNGSTNDKKSRKNSEGPFQLPGGYLSQEEWQAAATTATGSVNEQLLLAGKMTAARELWKETGINVRDQLDRLQPATLRTPTPDSPLSCEDANQRLYFLLAVRNDDLNGSTPTPTAAARVEPEEQDKVKLVLVPRSIAATVKEEEEETGMAFGSMSLCQEVNTIAIPDTDIHSAPFVEDEDEEEEVEGPSAVLDEPAAAAEEASSTSSTTGDEMELYKDKLQSSSLPFTASSSSLWDQHAAASASSTDAATPNADIQTAPHVSMIPLSLQLFFYGKSWLDHPFGNTAEDDYALFGTNAPTQTTVCRRACCSPRRGMSNMSSSSSYYCQPIGSTLNDEDDDDEDDEDDQHDDDDSPPAVKHDENQTSTRRSKTLPNGVSWNDTTTTATLTRQPSELSPSSSALHRVMRDYVAACHLYGCSGDRINAGVMTTIRFRLPTLRTSGSFHDADMLALAEILMQHGNSTLSHIRRLDFSISSREGRLPYGGRKGFRSHGALTLSKVLQQSQFIQECFLQRNWIGPYGASALFLAASRNRVLQKLVLRRCHVGERGALSFATHVCPSKVTGLREVDLSVNGIGFRGSIAVERALLHRLKQQQRLTKTTAAASTSDDRTGKPLKKTKNTAAPSQSHLLLVDLDGNLAFQEIMNSITHGMGILLGVLGTLLLSRRVEDSSMNHVLSCAVYSLSLLALYISSTLFHSFFALPPGVRSIFSAFDHCAIYILIAGSYTPFLRITLSHEPLWSVYLLVFLWSCCFAGMYVEVFHLDWAYKSKFSLAMYLGMGWSCVVCLPDLMAVLNRDAMRLLVLGGVAYTSGVPFFVRNNNLDHSMWHCFVLAGSIFHWWCVYRHVAVLP